jgi:nitrate/nitrite transporter NarK
MYIIFSQILFPDKIQTAFVLIGKGVAVSGFCTMFLYTSELFPTVLRGVAMGHCGFWGRVGSLIAPQLLFLVSARITFEYDAKNVQIQLFLILVDSLPAKECFKTLQYYTIHYDE